MKQLNLLPGDQENKNSITNPDVSHDLKENLAMSSDLSKRKEGAKNFKKFIDSFEAILFDEEVDEYLDHDQYERDYNRKTILDSVVPQSELMSIQALFLKEKPAILSIFSNKSLVSSAQKEEIYKLIKSFGFDIINFRGEAFIYNPEMIQEVIKKNKNIFGDLDIKEILDSKYFNLDDVGFGILLGYPKKVCEGYKKYKSYRDLNTPEGQELSLRMLNEANAFDFRQADKNIYGFTFVPYEAGEETILLRDRLRKAFQESGILKAWDTTKK